MLRFPRARVVPSALALINPRSPLDPLTVAPLTTTEEAETSATRYDPFCKLALQMYGQGWLDHAPERTARPPQSQSQD